MIGRVQLHYIHIKKYGKIEETACVDGAVYNASQGRMMQHETV